MQMIPLFKPFMPTNLSELDSIIHSGKLTYGEWGREFEKELSNFLGNQFILAMNSYNLAFLVALTTLGLKAGDEVIASPMSCLASNQPMATQGIKVIWADVDPNTGTLDPESVLRYINPKTKAIVHNHFCGYSGYIDELNAIAKEKGLYLIEDAIEAFGTSYQGKYIGNTGADITVFSFQTVRLPSTIEGGALAFKNKNLYEKCIRIRDYGIDRSNFRDSFGEININCNIHEPGYGATMSELNSFIGVEQMKSIKKLLKKQRQNAETWKNELRNRADIKCLKNIDETCPNYWVFGILADKKHEALEQFRRDGYYCSGVHTNNNIYSLFEQKQELIGVEEFNRKFLAIPSGWWLKNEEKYGADIKNC